LHDSGKSVTQGNRGLPRMLELVKLRLQALQDLRSNLVVEITGLGTLHAAHLALARHAVLHHVDMGHLLECPASCARTADCEVVLLWFSGKSRWLSACGYVGVTHASVELT